ncbi:interleukin-17 receptor D-like [Protopterus annectens]|uniref:interleukin-17 receptor D-like n=1 Tax=Protopterus annectens TaxID=7888 RepID=UPI001CF95E71|nr:interleukin-17 receptor D-like [Protopterus annectens]
MTAERQVTSEFIFSLIVKGMLQDCTFDFPCFEGTKSDVCHHAVGRPKNLVVKRGNNSECGKQDSAFIQWSPSEHGITFLLGFIIDLKGVTGPTFSGCRQLTLTNSIISEMVFEISFCLPTDTTYIITVYGYPVPPGRENDPDMWVSVQYTARTCTELNGPEYCNDCRNWEGSARETCRKKWMPANITFYQEGHLLKIIFDQAPTYYDISYYYVYYKRTNSQGKWNNTTKHHIHHAEDKHMEIILSDLTPGFDYSFIISSNVRGAKGKHVTYYFIEVVVENTFTPFVLSAVLVGLICILAIIITATRKCKKRKKAVSTCPLETLSEFAVAWTPQEAKVPKVFICYSSLEGEKHTQVILSFAAYLQEYCSCQVVLDLWESIGIAQYGYMNWLNYQLQCADFILVICSQGLKFLMETKHQKANWNFLSLSDMINDAVSCVAAVSLIAEKLYQAKIRQGSISRFLVAYFEYSSEKDIPGILELASKYKLMDDLPELFSHLHSIALCRPGYQLQVQGLAKHGYLNTTSGQTLSLAIQDMNKYIQMDPSWFHSLWTNGQEADKQISNALAESKVPQNVCCINSDC